jgi:hypothetical protein
LQKKKLKEEKKKAPPKQRVREGLLKERFIQLILIKQI